MNILLNPQDLWWLAGGAIFGGTIAWALASLIHRSRKLEALQRVESQLAAKTVQLEDLRNQLATLHQEYDDLRKEFRLMEVAKVSTETTLLDTQQHFQSQQKMLDEAKLTLSDTFRSLAAEALAGNNQGFLALAEEKLSS